MPDPGGAGIDAGPARGAGAEVLRPGYARFVLGALFIVYIFNFLDRQILSVLVEPIKQELGASDTAMGLLTGFAFAVFYTGAGLPLARVADRHSRTGLIAAGLVVWSLMTAASGLARSYAQLALARIGVGIGEASFTPSAHSLIADYFPPARRAGAMAVFAAGASLGAILGNVVGGVVGQAVGWRAAFFVVGLPGLLAAVWFRLSVREPPRGISEARHAAPQQHSTLAVVRRLLSSPSFAFLAVSASLHGFSSYGSSAWNAVFLMRVHGLSLAQTGLVLGLVSGSAGFVGQIVCGRLADRLGQRDPRWYMYFPAITSIAALPFLVGFLLIPDLWLAVAISVPGAFAASSWTGPTYAMAQGLAPLQMRAVASALVVFMLNLIGMGLGPLFVGWLNDALAPSLGLEAVRYSLLVAAIPHTLAAIFNLLAARTLRRDLEAASRE
jgi:predicted MFS family arabinose efflux permease